MNKNKGMAAEHGPFKGPAAVRLGPANRCYYHYNNICFLFPGNEALQAAKSNLFEVFFEQRKRKGIGGGKGVWGLGGVTC